MTREPKTQLTLSLRSHEERRQTPLVSATPTPQSTEVIPHFIVAAPTMHELLNCVKAISNSQAPVLITGETGTGKELIARAIHSLGDRRSQKFTAINCATLVRETAESQIFGHKRGSFTGAMSDHLGIIRFTEGGTLFLDEIGELGLELQPKLLRFLQEGEVFPVGATSPIYSTVRVVAATNCDLKGEVTAGRFRRDLFYRLNVVPLHLPPLRERREEIPLLIEHYFGRYCREAGKRDIRLSQEAIEQMTHYDWPGNVRELCHEIHRLALFAHDGEVISAAKLPPSICVREKEVRSSATKIKVLIEGDITLADATAELERWLIARALKRCGGNLTHAARSLQLTNKGLRSKMSRLGIKKNSHISSS